MRGRGAWPRTSAPRRLPTADGREARRGQRRAWRGAHDNRRESFVERELHDSDSTHGRTLRSSVKRTFSTLTALTLYLLIVSVITARTVALTLIKVQLNKTKTENNHFCLTGKMARYVAEAVTTHAPLAKHMFFRPELCAGLMHRAVGAAPPDSSTNFQILRTNGE